MMQKDYTYDMTVGSPIKLLISFAVPMLIGNVFQQLYNMVDAIVVGNYVSSNALGAVGATGPIIFLFFSLTIGLSSGVGVVVSQFFGAQDEENVKKTIASTMYIMVASGVLMGGIGYFTAEPIMSFLGTPEAIMDDAVIYMQVSCIGIIAVSIYNGVGAILRALGDSIRPLIFLIIACIVNIILDLVFVIIFHMGVFGVGLATFIAQVLTAVAGTVFALVKVPLFKMKLKEYVPNGPIIKECLLIGIPVALQNSMIAISCIVLQSVVNSFGETIVTAFTAENRFEQLVQQPFNSLGAALATYTGQNIGAGKTRRVRRGFWAGTVLSVGFSLIMLPIAWFGGETIMRLFTDDTMVIIEGARGIRITSLFYAALGMIYVTRNVLNGSGDAKFAMFSGFIEVTGRVGFARPLAMIPSIGVLSIWYTTGLTWLLTAVISIIRYVRGKWQEKGIVKVNVKLDESYYG